MEEGDYEDRNPYYSSNINQSINQSINHRDLFSGQRRPVNFKHDARCVMSKVGGRQKPKRGDLNLSLLINCTNCDKMQHNITWRNMLACLCLPK